MGDPTPDVLRPWVNGLDLTRGLAIMWIIDFGVDMTGAGGRALRGAIRVRAGACSTAQDRAPPCSPCRALVAYTRRADLVSERRSPRLQRYIATPRLTKHRLFVWLKSRILPDSQIVAVAQDDDFTFGVLHSRVHEIVGSRQRHPAARSRIRLPLHADDLLRDLPVPGPNARAAREGRGGRPPPRRAPRRLAQPARPRSRRPRQAHPHQPLQRSAPPGSPTPTPTSTRPSSPPTAGPPI